MLRSQYPLLSQSFLGEDVAPLVRNFRRVFDSMLRDVWEPPNLPWGGRAGEFYPQVTVSEDERQIKVQAEVPGMRENDIEITYEPGFLTLRGEKKEEEQRKSESGQVQFSECRYGSFERRIPLRRDIEEDQIQASYDRGVLTISLPKTEEARASSKRIPIRLGSSQVETPSGRPSRTQPSAEGASAH